MGLEFLGNPYENEYQDDSDFEIERDEEWVVPIVEVSCIIFIFYVEIVCNKLQI